jgi:hypothetical protein
MKEVLMKQIMILTVALLATTSSVALAQDSLQTLDVTAVMSPQEALQFDFPTEAPHFLLLVQRTGTLEGEGALDGASATEYGMHDISPGNEGVARGYFIAETEGGQAFIQWEVQVTFVPGTDGPVTLDNGVWHFAGGTGDFDGIQGAGTMHIKPASETDREFSFQGQYTLPEN